MSNIPVFVHQIRLEAREVISLVLRPVNAELKLPPATAGAHIQLFLTADLTRSYSLVYSSPEEYVIAVLKEKMSRGGSAYVHEKLHVGSVLEVSSPRNHFPLIENAPLSVLVAGGIGITPIYAMLQRIIVLRQRAELIYCSRSKKDAAFAGEIEALIAARPNIRLRFYWDDVEGSPPILERMLAGYPSDTHFYCCGPARMLDSFVAACETLGQRHAHIERFSASQTSEGALSGGGYAVELRRSGKRIFVPPGANLLKSMLSAGCAVPHSCLEGLCGTCETKVISGVVDHRDSILTHEERERSKSLMPCVSGCAGEELVLDI